MCWHILQKLVIYLPQQILNKAYDYLEKVSGKPVKMSRSDDCVTATENW